MQFEFGEFVFDGEARDLTRAGARVRLAPKAFELLRILIDERPRAIPKRELQERLWPDVIVEEANLKNLVAEIRAALGSDEWIRTVSRFGYAFEAPPDAPPPATAALVAGDRVHRLRDGETVIGRDGACGVVIDVIGVSRRHARVTLRASQATLEDLGSKNGTWRNEQRIVTPVLLEDGDTIRVGPLTLVFRSRSQPETVTLDGADA